MQTGVVALLDALGFKSHSHNGNAHAIVHNLIKAKHHTTSAIGETKSTVLGSEGPSSHISDIDFKFFSDTAVFSVSSNSNVGLGDQSEIESSMPQIKELMLWLVVVHSSAFIGSMLESEPTLVFRGCVAAGEFLAKDDFYLGPAIDEAASCFEVANGGFVWLTQRAREWILPEGESTIIDSDLECILLDYSVPLTTGTAFETKIINPLFFTDKDRIESLLERVEQSFRKSDLSVQIKRQNTLKMLGLAASKLKSQK